jgi:hypothetical protein
MLIVAILEAKEAEAVFAKSEDWIVFEASNIDSISKTGTLRLGCVAHITSNKLYMYIFNHSNSEVTNNILMKF